MPSFYVKRTSKHNAAGYAFSKALSANQAAKESAAWKSCGESTETIPVTPETRSLVRRWKTVTHADDARTPVWFQGEEMTIATYRLEYETA